MKATITITGQVSGNLTLRNAILSGNGEEKRTMFNGYEITFPTKKEAKKAMWEGFKYLKRTLDQPRVGSMSGVRYSKFGSLSYDASNAQLS